MSYQLTCPKCKYEFSYNNGYYDKEITRLGIEIQNIMQQLVEFKILPEREKKARSKWRKTVTVKLAEKQKEIAELKAIRKISDQQIKAYEYQIFKNIVKETVGEKQYKKFIEEMTSELEGYRLSGLMRHEYTRANSKKDVISINKI